MNERGRGGLELPEELDGGETGGGAQNFCRRRFPGAPAVERSVLGDAPESGEAARLHRKAGGGVCWPESVRTVVGDREVFGKILRPGGALEGGVRGERERTCWRFIELDY